MQFGSSSGISFSGLASGLDTNSIISQLTQLERRPIQRLQIRQNQLKAQKDAYASFRSQLQGLNSAVGAFSLPSAFAAFKTTSSNSDIASIVANSNGAPGIFDLKVSKLAQADKVASKAFESPTTALGITGKFKLNDKEISLSSTDTLSTLATKINDAKVGVTASVLNGGSGKAYLTLTSDSTGTANAVRLADVMTAIAGAQESSPVSGNTPNSFTNQSIRYRGNNHRFDVNSGYSLDTGNYEAKNASFALANFSDEKEWADFVAWANKDNSTSWNEIKRDGNSAALLTPGSKMFALKADYEASVSSGKWKKEEWKYVAPTGNPSESNGPGRGASPERIQSSVLSALGLQGGFANSGDGSFITSSFASATTALSTANPAIEGKVYQFGVNGYGFRFDSRTESLTDFANKLTSAGVQASVVEDGGKFHLKISGDSVLDADGLLGKMGVLKSVDKLVAAQDAEFEIDGVKMTSATNTVENVVQGTTITFLKADSQSTVKLSVSKDTDSVMNTVKGFATAFNKVQDFIKQNSKFDSETFQSGILFGDSLSLQVQNTLGASLFNNVKNLAGSYSNLTQVGFSLDSAGSLQVDEAAFKKALDANPDALAKLFRSSGTSENDKLTFVSNSNKTNASSGSGYSVEVTKLATQSTYSANTAQTQANRGGEVLTFSGQLFGSTSYNLNVRSGSSVQDLVSQINSDSTLKEKVKASVVDGKLKIESKAYGSATEFNVYSNIQAASNTSGIGTAGQSTKVKGADIEGKINGNKATGSGQFLLSNEGDSEGLQVQYTGTALGTIGQMKFSKGVAGGILDNINSFLDNESGLLQNSTTTLDQQIEDLNQQIERVNERSIRKEAELRNRFVLMEQAIQASQAQLSRMQAVLRG